MTHLNTWVTGRNTDWTEAFILPGQKIYGRDIIVDVTLHQRKQMPELHQVCIGLTDGAWTCKVRESPAIVEPSVACTLYNC